MQEPLFVLVPSIVIEPHAFGGSLDIMIFHPLSGSGSGILLIDTVIMSGRDIIKRQFKY